MVKLMKMKYFTIVFFLVLILFQIQITPAVSELSGFKNPELIPLPKEVTEIHNTDYDTSNGKVNVVVTAKLSNGTNGIWFASRDASSSKWNVKEIHIGPAKSCIAISMVDANNGYILYSDYETYLNYTLNSKIVLVSISDYSIQVLSKTNTSIITSCSLSKDSENNFFAEWYNGTINIAYKLSSQSTWTFLNNQNYLFYNIYGTSFLRFLEVYNTFNNTNMIDLNFVYLRQGGNLQYSKIEYKQDMSNSYGGSGGSIGKEVTNIGNIIYNYEKGALVIPYEEQDGQYTTVKLVEISDTGTNIISINNPYFVQNINQIDPSIALGANETYYASFCNPNAFTVNISTYVGGTFPWKSQQINPTNIKAFNASIQYANGVLNILYQDIGNAKLYYDNSNSQSASTPLTLIDIIPAFICLAIVYQKKRAKTK